MDQKKNKNHCKRGGKKKSKTKTFLCYKSKKREGKINDRKIRL
jgi:hypothetical protein